MSQVKLVLYHFPGACSQVAVCALEAAELDYELVLVNLLRGEQTRPDYLSISPLGKIPAMMIDGKALVENAAILTYIAALRPEARIFPSAPTPDLRAEIVGGLAFCGGTLHPQVRGIANPSRLTNGDQEGVRAKSMEMASTSFGYAERTLEGRGWWLGERSIVDVYLNWAFSIAVHGGFDPTPFPLMSELHNRLAIWPAFARMQAEEIRSRERLGI